MSKTIDDVISATGIGHTTVRGWIRKGLFQADKQGGQYHLTDEQYAAMVAFARERKGNKTNLTKPRTRHPRQPKCKAAGKNEGLARVYAIVDAAKARAV